MFGYFEVITISAVMSIASIYLTHRHYYRAGLEDGARLGIARTLRMIKSIQAMGGDITIGDCDCPACKAEREKGTENGPH
jgi:hypothetical protein